MYIEKAFERSKERNQVNSKVEMRRDCNKCSKWKKHFYWFHLDHTNTSFCLKIASSLMKKMDLLKDFCTNFKGQIDETVELKGPSGNVWQVSVIKSAKEITFQSGWKDFVIANNIEANDLLIFKYSARSSFQVQIFDHGGCERISTYFSGIEKMEVRESSDSSIKVFEGPDRNLQQDKITICSSSSDSEYGTDNPLVKMSGRRARNCSSDSEYRTDSASEKMSGGRASRPAISKESNGRGKFKARTNVQIAFRKDLFLSPSQKKRVLQLCELIQPENRCFATFMTLSMTAGRCRFYIPIKFARKHLPRHAEKLDGGNFLKKAI